MSIGQRFAFDPVMHYQQPAAHSLFGRVHGVASDRLLDLGGTSPNSSRTHFAQPPSVPSTSVMILVPRASAISDKRIELTRFVPFSYFWTCWNDTPIFEPSSSWLNPWIKR